MSEYKRNMKVIVLGDSNVGKTSLIHRYMRGEYTDNQFQTVGVDFVFRDYICPVTSNKYCVHIWDTAGQERFHTLVSQFYRGSDGAIICFDISNIASFQAIPKWISEIRSHSPDVQIIICGTKGDLLDSRTSTPVPRRVSIDDAIYTASSFNCSYIETSSRDGSNINNLFDVIINHIIDFGAVNKPSFADDMPDNSIRLSNKKYKEFHKQIMPKSSKSNIILATANENDTQYLIPNRGNDENGKRLSYSQSIRNRLYNLSSNIYCSIV